MHRSILLGFGLLAVAACQEGAIQAPPETRAYAEPAPALAEDAVAVRGAKVSGGIESDAEAPDVPEGGQLLAYSYATQLELPSSVVADVMAMHRDACQAAGVATCQVLQASLSGHDPENPYASLQFRAVPSYIATFRDGLVGEINEAGGRIIESSQSVEDLTRQILDTRARLEAQKTLRDRLLVLLERPTGDVGDLLQVERELARVQAQIESMTSQLAYLEGRVSMNLMNVTYRSEPKPYTRTQARPLRDAINGFFSTLAWSLADLISFIATALPWFVLGLPALWVLIRLLKAWRR